MLLHPELLSGLANLQHQNRLREAEIWRLSREARQGRVNFLGRLFHHLITAVGQRLRLQPRPNSVKPDLVNLHR